MKTLLYIFGIALITIAGCAKETDSLSSGYPTTYSPLSATELSSLKAEYLNDKDSCFQTSLNTYGFCSFDEYRGTNCSSNYQPISGSQAKQLALEFIKQNAKYTGVKDTSLIDSISLQSYNNYLSETQESKLWRVTIGNQKASNLEVMSSGIYLKVSSTGVSEVTGNWFPEVYVPAKEVITYEKAKALLVGKQYDFMCWTNIHLDITKDTQWQELSQKKLIYPVTKTNSIELHVVWVLQTGYFLFYVDVMTGEVMAANMQIIC